jgi:hypothetical protein
MLRSSRPQPGQKSSLVLNSLGRFAGSFGLAVGSARALMISFSFRTSRSSSRTPTISVWKAVASFSASAAVPPCAIIACQSFRYG